MNIRLLYLYLFAFIGLLICVIGAVQLVNLGLTVLVFPDSDNYEYYAPAREFSDMSEEEMEAMEAEQQASAARQQTRQRQRELITSVSMLVVCAPLYVYHWRIISSENQAGKKAGK